jgi:hypothetical protein
MTMLVAGHHKTATQWFIKVMLYLAQRNGSTFQASHLSGVWRQGDEIDCFFNANSAYALFPKTAERGVHIIRNPLDMLVSAYYSHLLTHTTDGWPDLARHREALGKLDRAAGYQLELAYMSSHGFLTMDGLPEVVAPFAALTAWNYDDHRFLTVRMEDLTSEPQIWLPRIFEHFGRAPPPGLDEAIVFSDFRHLAGGRAKGTIDQTSHYRSGKAGEWLAELPVSTANAVKAMFAPLMTRYYPEIT